MSTLTNVTLLTLATGAMGTGIERVFSHDYMAGGLGVVIGIALFFLYEKYPNAVPQTPSTPPQS